MIQHQATSRKALRLAKWLVPKLYRGRNYEDALQVAIIAAWQAEETLRLEGREDEGTGLMIFRVRTALASLAREELRRKHRVFETVETLPVVEVESDHETRVEVSDLLDQLPAVDREILFDLYWRKRELEEVAARCGISGTGVWKRKSVAVEKLRRILSG